MHMYLPPLTSTRNAANSRSSDPDLDVDSDEVQVSQF